MKINKKRLINLVIDLCKINTVNPPGNEYRVKELLVKKFEEMGADVKTYEKEKGRTNVVGQIKGNKPGKVIAIIGHTDVVPVEDQDWDFGPFDPTITKDNRIIARGAIDNKGPFAAVLEGVQALLETYGDDFTGEILLIAAADEEQGSVYGVEYLFGEVGLKCDYALIPDNGDWSQMTYGEMGILDIDIISKGIEFHGSVPEKGFNAIYPLSILIQKLHEYEWQTLIGSSEFEGTVLNIGLIHGGSAPNIVPNKATLNCMWRYPDGISASDILSIVKSEVAGVIKNIPQSKFKIEEKMKSLPFIGKKDGLLASTSIAVAKQLDLLPIKPVTIRAETVAKHVNTLTGAEVLVNGPEDNSMNQMHRANESVGIENLENFARFYSQLMYNLLSQDTDSI